MSPRRERGAHTGWAPQRPPSGRLPLLQAHVFYFVRCVAHGSWLTHCSLCPWQGGNGVSPADLDPASPLAGGPRSLLKLLLLWVLSMNKARSHRCLWEPCLSQSRRQLQSMHDVTDSLGLLLWAWDSRHHLFHVSTARPDSVFCSSGQQRGQRFSLALTCHSWTHRCLREVAVPHGSLASGFVSSPWPGPGTSALPC